MKLKLSLTLCATGLCLAGGNAFAIGTSQAFNVTSTIVSSIALNVTNPLRFGDTVKPAAATTVTIAPSDSGAALLTATGTPARPVQGTFQNSSITMTCTTAATCGTSTITVNNFLCSINAGASGTTCSGTFDSSGDISNITAGATENLAANQGDGNYSGTQTFTLDYT